MFWEDGAVYRQIHASGKGSYDRLMHSGLYDELIAAGFLLTHEDVTGNKSRDDAYKIIRPRLVPFISYPYEWAFSQLKDAALLTLDIQTLALGRDMTLRDASAYNVQFIDSKPVFIDTLSLEPYAAGSPWQAYRQFCQHFLAPLALMTYGHVDMGRLAGLYIDGVPLDVATKLLPLKARLRPGIAIHIGAHARLQKQHQSAAKNPTRPMTKMALLGLIDNLRRTILSLKLPSLPTEWGDYYEHTNYSNTAMEAKQAMVAKILSHISPKRVVDLGANDGTFSRIAANQGAFTISADIDPIAVEQNYLRAKASRQVDLLPLRIDLTNPSPAIGWNNEERASFSRRAQADTALALALIHHLAISGNLPLSMIARYFASLAPHLVIEFVPKEDSQVVRLLATREDIFPNYTKVGFEDAFRQCFDIVSQAPVDGSMRTLYHMRRSGEAT